VPTWGLGSDVRLAPPSPPLTLSVPLIVTSPVARIVTGVFAAFFEKVTVTPAGIVTVVKLNTPLGGSVRVVFAAGANAPSAPVLPLTNTWAAAWELIIPERITPRMMRCIFMFDLLYSGFNVFSTLTGGDTATPCPAS
jgi:hypothetical protein